MANEVVLYDIISKGHCASWSLNPWKARASLNYKGIPYRTEWLEYPDIAPTFEKLGIPKNDTSVTPFLYSCPAAQMPDGTYIMDSRKIAEALDKLQPEPSLHMDKADVISRAQAAVGGTHQNLGPIYVPRIPEILLKPRSAEYFEETRAKRFGMPLKELAKSEKAGETAWKGAEPHLTELKNILTENKDGPYVLGKGPSFADMIIAGFWTMMKKIDKGDVYDRLMSFDSSFPEHMKACQKWFEREDH